ncbi:MAG: hypothetical protein IJZ44_07305 [Lachnospiraceae bacterium]|nr:hypothetical protein [Lachnospiraceae bacterium]
MINQERIQLMTKLASYEENEGKKHIAIGSFFRSDYIGLQIIKSILGATVAYCIVFGLYIFYDFEFFMQDIYKMDLLEFGKNVLFYYFIFVVVYSVIAYIVFSYKYHKAKKNLKKYYHHLKQLNAMYDLENRK